MNATAARSLLPALAGGTRIGRARRVVADAFRHAGLESADLDARLLIGHALGLDHAGLAAAAEDLLDPIQAERITALAERRLAREPVARITGHREFWGLSLQLTAATLVPRPDTETVVEAALAALRGEEARPLRIADLGTGSGALLLALLSELPNASGVGTDRSLAAVETARRNAASAGLARRAAFVVCDFAAGLRPAFDLVVSNPPYIASGDIGALAPEVRHHDPRAALDGGPDGMDCYRAIAVQVPPLLASSGILAVEVGIGQMQAVRELFTAAGLRHPEERRDLAGVPRALVVRAPAAG